jgi:hypothetical protein
MTNKSKRGREEKGGIRKATKEKTGGRVEKTRRHERGDRVRSK